MKKRIMVLGAGIYQLPLIKKAKEMGLEVIVVSRAGDYPGISEADIFLDIDTRDSYSILAAAKEHNISGIATTGTDVSVPAVGTVADALGLRGPTKKMADNVTHKTSFRSFQMYNDIRHPVFKNCLTIQDALDFYQRLNDKMVIKPDDSSGSRGVTVINKGLSGENVKVAYDNALNSSQSGRVCAEAFIEGVEVGGDGFFLNGELCYFTDTCKHMNGLVVQGHSIPGTLPKEQKLEVKKEVAKVAAKLGYDNGPVNFDVIINDDGATVLEMGLRNGGNGILELIELSEQIELLEWLLLYILGDSVPVKKPLGTKAYSSYVFGSEQAGKLEAVTGLEELKAAVPSVCKLVMAKKPGDHVDPFIHNPNLVGYLLLECGASDYHKTVKQIKETLRVRVGK